MDLVDVHTLKQFVEYCCPILKKREREFNEKEVTVRLIFLFIIEEFRLLKSDHVITIRYEETRWLVT